VLIKRTVIPLVILMVSVAFFTAGCFSKPTKDTNAPASGPVGVIDMDAAIKAHPKYQQLKTLQQQYSTLAAQADAAKQAQSAARSGNGSAVLPQSGPVSDDAALNAAMQQEFSEKMAAKQAELKQSLAAKADRVQRDLSAEFKAYSEQVDQEYQPQIFSIQLKLKTVQLSKEEMAALQAELEKLQNARSEKLAAKEQELKARMDKIMAPEQEAVEQQLNAYAGQLNAEMSQKAAAKSAEITARNITPATGSMMLPDSGLRSDLEEQLAMKRQEISVLKEFIIQDIRDKVAKVAAERRLDTVLTNIQVNVSAMDITDAVIAEFKK